MSLAVEPSAPPEIEGGPPLAPSRTPRPTFQITRRLVGASRWPLVLLTAIYAISVADQYVVPTLFPLLKQEFGMSDSALGVLSGSYVVVVTVGTLPFGYLADRKRRTRIIAWGTAAWGAAMIWTGLAWSYASLFAARMTLGLWDPANKPTSQSLLVDYYPTVQRSKVMSVYQTGQLIGILVVPVSAAMAVQWGWRSAFFFLSVPAFIVAILARRLPEPVRGQQDRLQQGLNAAERPSKYDTMSSREAYRELFRIRAFTLTALSSGVGSLFFGSIGTWSPTFFVRYHDMSISQAAGALSLLALGGLVGVLVSGWAADYLTYRGLRAGRLLVSVLTRLASVPLFILTFTVSSTPVMLLSFTLASMCLVAPQAPMNAARADVLHPRLRGRGTAVDAIVQSTTAAIAPILVGFLSDRYGLRSAFLICIPLMALSGIIVLFAIPPYIREERELRELIRREAFGDDGDGSQGPDGNGSGPDANSDGGPSAEPDARVTSEGDGAATLSAAAVVTARTSAPARASPDGGATVAPLLTVENLDLSYGSIQVLFGVGFALPDHGIHALVGRNGVGKTTLLSAIAGLVDGHRGRIVFAGTDLTGVPADQRVKLGITLMAGGRSTFPTLTVQENLWIGSYPFHRSDALVRQRMEALLDVFPPLRSRLRQSGGTLSGGEQQMVALGRALMSDPRLLLLDEPSGGLAPVFVAEIGRIVERLKAAGTTVLMVEQNVRLALAVADRFVALRDGLVLAHGPVSELRGAYEDLVRRIYL